MPRVYKGNPSSNTDPSAVVTAREMSGYIKNMTSQNIWKTVINGKLEKVMEAFGPTTPIIKNGQAVKHDAIEDIHRCLQRLSWKQDATPSWTQKTHTEPSSSIAATTSKTKSRLERRSQLHTTSNGDLHELKKLVTDVSDMHQRSSKEGHKIYDQLHATSKAHSNEMKRLSAQIGHLAEMVYKVGMSSGVSEFDDSSVHDKSQMPQECKKTEETKVPASTKKPESTTASAGSHVVNKEKISKAVDETSQSVAMLCLQEFDREVDSLTSTNSLTTRQLELLKNKQKEINKLRVLVQDGGIAPDKRRAAASKITTLCNKEKIASSLKLNKHTQLQVQKATKKERLLFNTDIEKQLNSIQTDMV